MARSKGPKQSFAKDSRTTHAAASVLSAFHPTLPLFAKAVLSLDSWHIRVLDPTTALPRNDYALDKGQTCRCLAWGFLPLKHKEKTKKKRKIEEGPDEGLLVAGTSDGTAFLFLPAQDAEIARLQGGHTGEITAVCLTDSSIWTAGSDGKVIEWDTKNRKILRSIVIDSVNALSALALHTTDLLAASYTIHHIRLPGTAISNKYTTHTSPVNSLLFSATGRFLSTAEDDRYINVFSLETNVQEKAFIAESDVRKVAYANEMLCAVTVDGAVEFFPNPFTPSPTSSDKRQKSQVNKSVSQFRIVRPDSSVVPILDVSARPDDTMIVAWNEGVRTVFETVKFKDESGVMKSTELVRSPQPMAAITNGLKEKPKKGYHDNDAHIGAGNDTGDIEMLEHRDRSEHGNGSEHGNDSDDEADSSDGEPAEEPTLADRLNLLEVNAVAPTNPLPTSKAVLTTPSASSLTTVLTQALKTDDTALLESCLHHSDSKIILATVRRLDATLAVSLLEQLAGRISRKPGRSADLGTWVRWTIVVHGGYLASLPKLIQRLSALHGVLASRAATLPRLLALQGRLDMVDAQMELRQERGLKSATGGVPSDVEYVEGESDRSDDEDIDIEDASQLGGLETSEDDSDEEEEDADLDAEDDFSEDSGDGNEFAELDASMELMREDAEEQEEDLVASDDDA